MAEVAPVDTISLAHRETQQFLALRAFAPNDPHFPVDGGAKP
jgi:hypothetical protein